jgi:hypothetical protein
VGTCHSSHVPPLSTESHPGEVPLTAEEVARQMREAWTQDDDARVAAWNTQCKKDRAEKNQQDRQVREVMEAQHGGSKRKQRNSAEWLKRTNSSSTHSTLPVASANGSNHGRLLMSWRN